MNLMALIARVVLAAVFAVAGAAKLADRTGSRKSLADFGLPGFLLPSIGVLLPLLELTCAVALIPAASAWWGAAGALFLLSLFIVAMAILLARGRKPDCHCFGQLHSEPIGMTTISRNAVLAGLAVLVVTRGPSDLGPGVGESVAALSRAPAFSLSLLIVVSALAAFEFWMLLHVLRQNGRLLLRLEAVEAKVGVGPGQASAGGLPVGVEAPAFSLLDVDGNTATLGALGGRGPLLLFFTEPGCGACDSALPEVSRWQREHTARLSVVLIGRGDAAINRTKSRAHQLKNVLLQSDQEISHAYRVNATPSAVLVKEGLIASPLATGIPAIRSLVAEATMPAPLKRDDAVPPLALPDLKGRTVELSGPKKRLTVLLFWNPSCGFCQAMLKDLTAWEHDRPREAPDLVVVSTGSIEANRKQQLRSPVLIDSDFRVGRIFGATGTPSAVLLDQSGRVASGVSVGAQAVLALAGGVPADSSVPA